MVDTAVLGAGALGVATAYYLNRAGDSVCVLERRGGGARDHVLVGNPMVG
jgi:glycine/D-amino acid oxidase-like deaminating enzyme